MKIASTLFRIKNLQLKRLLLLLFFITNLSLPEILVAKNIGYRITTHTADNATDNDIMLRFYGAKTKTWTGWIELSGHFEEQQVETFTYTIPDVGHALTIEVYVKNQVPFRDDWLGHSISIEHPHLVNIEFPEQGHSTSSFTKSTFTMGNEILSIGTLGVYKYTSPGIKNTPPIKVLPDGAIQFSSKLMTIVHFENNEKSEPSTAMDMKESWTTINDIAISTEVSSSDSKKIGAEYKYDTKFAGEFTVSAEVAWENAMSKAREETTSNGYTKEINWAFKVPGNSAVFRKRILNIPQSYQKSVTSDNKETRYIRKPGGNINDIAGGEQIQIPKRNKDGSLMLDSEGNVVPVLWDRIEHEFMPFMDQTNINLMKIHQQKWIDNKWVVRITDQSELFGTYEFHGYAPHKDKEIKTRKHHIITLKPAGNSIEMKAASGETWEITPNIYKGNLIYDDRTQKFLVSHGIMNMHTKNGKIIGLYGLRGYLRKIKKYVPVNLKNVEGNYQKSPVSNNWHNGSISSKDGYYQWKNAAGIRWNLKLDKSHEILKTDETNPYHLTGPKDFILVTDALGNITGFTFGGELYRRLNN